MLFLHSHRCHPNRNQVLNNKDHNNDDNKGEAEDRTHLGLRYFADYRQIRKLVKSEFADSDMLFS